jgi:hypothetical protein
LIGIFATQAIGRVDKNGLDLSLRREVPQCLQTRTDQGGATIAIILELPLGRDQVAVPEASSVYEDHLEDLWMVPDVASFPDAVAAINFASAKYKIDVTDSDNPLLQEDENEGEEMPLENSLNEGLDK